MNFKAWLTYDVVMPDRSSSEDSARFQVVGQRGMPRQESPLRRIQIRTGLGDELGHVQQWVTDVGVGRQHDQAVFRVFGLLEVFHHNGMQRDLYVCF